MSLLKGAVFSVVLAVGMLWVLHPLYTKWTADASLDDTIEHLRKTVAGSQV